MKEICKHCGTPYSEQEVFSLGFCCSGCEQVYGLIQAGGLEGYYALQDRQGRPVGDAVESTSDFYWADRLQAESETTSTDEVNARVTLLLSGMTCLGCVWLVERLARRCVGLVSVRVSLERQSLDLEWKPGECVLSQLLLELQHFGYRAAEMGARYGRGLSPLAWRSSLTLVFALNGLLLSAPEYYKLDFSAYGGLIQLLLLLFCFLSFVVGGGYFVVPAWQAIRQGKLHYDLLPALGLSLALLGSLLDLFRTDLVGFSAWQFLVLCALSLSIRWMLACLWEWGGARLGVVPLEPWVFRWLRSYTLWVLLMAGILGVLHGFNSLLALLVLSSFYPIARSVGSDLGRRGFISYLGLLGVVVIGIVAGQVGALGSVIVIGLVGLLWSFVWFRLRMLEQERGDSHA